jgi:phycobilisome rod-core linker protein
MTLTRRPYPSSTQNARVAVEGGREEGRIEDLINRAYRQVFFHAMQVDRDPYLESQLRNGNITVRDFIRGLLLSERFQQGYYQCSSNYRMVDQVIGRVLGRPCFSEDERLSWSITIAESGLTGFIDTILDSQEYMTNFGYDRVPQQRSRLLPGRDIGEMPIYQRFPRYGSDWRDSLQERAPSPNRMELLTTAPLKTSAAWANGQPPAWALKAWLALAIVGSFEIGRVLLTLAAEMLHT